MLEGLGNRLHRDHRAADRDGAKERPGQQKHHELLVAHIVLTTFFNWRGYRHSASAMQ